MLGAYVASQTALLHMKRLNITEFPLFVLLGLLVATLKKFYVRHHDLVNPYNVAVSRIVSDVFASDAP